MHTLPTLALVSALSACVVVPVVNTASPSLACETRTRSLSLEIHSLPAGTTPVVCRGGLQTGTQMCAAGVLAVMAVVTGGSAVVSGSIVMVGNTAHWLEYQGRCGDGYLARAQETFLGTIDAIATLGSRLPDADAPTH